MPGEKETRCDSCALSEFLLLKCGAIGRIRTVATGGVHCPYITNMTCLRPFAGHHARGSVLSVVYAHKTPWGVLFGFESSPSFWPVFMHCVVN